MLERFVCLQKVFRKREHDSKAAGNDIADVAENGELEFVLFSGKRVIGKLGRNCDQRSAQLFDLRQNPLQSPQFDVAVGAPSTTIKGDHHGAFVQHSLQSDGGTVRIHQNEVFDPISFFHRSRADAATSELVCCAVHDFELFGRQDVIPIVIASFIELACSILKPNWSCAFSPEQRFGL